MASAAAAVLLSGCIDLDTYVDVSLREDGLADVTLTLAVDATVLYESMYLPMATSAAEAAEEMAAVSEDYQDEYLAEIERLLAEDGAAAAEDVPLDVLTPPASGAGASEVDSDTGSGSDPAVAAAGPDVLSYEDFMWETMFEGYEAAEEFCLDVVDGTLDSGALTSSDRYVSPDRSAYGFSCRFDGLPPEQVARLVADDPDEFSLDLVRSDRGWSVSGSIDSEDLFDLGSEGGLDASDPSAELAGLMTPAYTLVLSVSAPGELVSSVGGRVDGSGQVVWELSGAPTSFSADWEEPGSSAGLLLAAMAAAFAAFAAFAVLRRRTAGPEVSQASMQQPSGPHPPGWYPAPDGRMYYWDGSGWTGQVADRPAPGPDSI